MLSSRSRRLEPGDRTSLRAAAESVGTRGLRHALGGLYTGYDAAHGPFFSVSASARTFASAHEGDATTA